MREFELREWIEELAEEQGEKERQRSERLVREQQALEERRQRYLETVEERCDEEDVDPDLLLTLLGYTEELAEKSEEELEKRREEVIADGEDVDLPNETSAFTDGITPRSGGSNAIRPYYVEIRGKEGGLEHTEYHPESINVRIDERTNRFLRWDKKTVNWWFAFTPDETKLWDFRIAMPYRGFHRQRAPLGDSGASRADLEEEYRVHQYNPGPIEKERRIVDLRHPGDPNITTRFDRVLSGHYATELANGDQALLHVHQKFQVSVAGSGSQAELNFSTGTGNRLPAPYFHVY